MKQYEIEFSLIKSGFSYLYGSISYLFGYEKNRCFFLMTAIAAEVALVPGIVAVLQPCVKSSRIVLHTHMPTHTLRHGHNRHLSAT
jgi:hypothetical protein